MENNRSLQSSILLMSICIFILVTFVPFFSADFRIFNILVIISFALFVLSVLLNRFIDYRIFLMIILIIIFNYFIYKTQWSEYTTLANKMLMLFEFWFPIIVSMYLFSGKEKLGFRKKSFILHFFIVIYTLTSITTILGNINHSIPSRFLATSTLEGHLAKLYRGENIGGFGFCYMSIFVVLLLVYMYKKTKKKIYILPLVITYIMCIESQYTILILLVILVSFLTIFDNLSRTKKIIIVSLAGVSLIIIFANLKHLLMWMINLFKDQETVQVRLYELYYLISGTSLSASDLLLRQDVYEKSWEAFISNPFIGNFRLGLGGHSEMLDLLGSMGLIGLLFLFVIIILFYRTVSKKSMNYEPFEKYHIRLTAIFILILACLNPVLSARELGFAGFFVMIYVSNSLRYNL